MHLDFLSVLSNLAGLFLLIATGYIAVHLEILPVSASGPLSRLLLQITLPCTIFTSLLRPYEAGFLEEMLTAALLAVPLNLAVLGLALLLRGPCGVSKARRGVWTFCASFSNFGFMGYPIALALFGEKGLALAAMCGLSFNLMVYSIGALLVRGDGPEGSAGGSVGWRAVLLTGINLSAFLGLIFYFTQLSVPTALLAPMTHLANLTTPLSMLVTGMNLYGGNWGAMFRDREALSACGVRLVAGPLLCVGLLSLLDLVLPLREGLLFGVLLIVLSMPSPGVSSILAERYGADRAFAARIVFLSSLFCIVTIPLVALVI